MRKIAPWGRKSLTVIAAARANPTMTNMEIAGITGVDVHYAGQVRRRNHMICPKKFTGRPPTDTSASLRVEMLRDPHRPNSEIAALCGVTPKRVANFRNRFGFQSPASRTMKGNRGSDMTDAAVRISASDAFSIEKRLALLARDLNVVVSFGLTIDSQYADQGAGYRIVIHRFDDDGSRDLKVGYFQGKDPEAIFSQAVSHLQAIRADMASPQAMEAA